MEGDGQTRCIRGDYHLILNPWLRRCATTKMESESTLSNRYFSKIDLTNACVQIPLSPQSKSLTIITTPWGLFRPNFLPFIFHLSSGLFQVVIYKVIQGLDGVLAYQDNVTMFGDTREEINLHLESVFSQLIEWNVSIKETQYKFGVPELEFREFKINETRYQPNPEGMESASHQSHLRSI